MQRRDGVVVVVGRDQFPTRKEKSANVCQLFTICLVSVPPHTRVIVQYEQTFVLV